MTLKGYVKLVYHTESVGIPQYSDAYPDLIEDQDISMQVPSTEMNIHQYFNLFRSFLRAIGFCDKTIMKGAVHLAFTDSINLETEEVRKIAKEYDLILSEDLPAIIEDRLKHDKQWLEQNKSEPDIWEKRYFELRRRYSDVEAVKYTDEELDAMCVEAGGTKLDSMKKWNGFIPGTPEAKKEGCICPSLDNSEMPDDRKWIDVECPIHGRKKND